MAFRSKSGTEVPQTMVYQNYCVCKGMRILLLEFVVAFKEMTLFPEIFIKLNVVFYVYMFA